MNHKYIEILENLPIKKSVFSLIVPTVLAMLVQILYNLTDTFFIGKLNDPFQVAAVTITMPIFMMLMAISGIFAHGAASFLSRSLGEKKYLQAKQISTISIFLMATTAIVIMILFLWKIENILIMIGTSENTYNYAKSYLQIIISGSMMIMLNFGISQLFRAEGGAKIAMLGMMVGTGCNIILDPIFIFMLNMGVIGAAYATIIGNTISLIFYIICYKQGKSLVTPSLKHLSFNLNHIKEILKIGLPSSLSQIMMSFGSALSYYYAAFYGDYALAAMGVAQRIISIAIFTFIGISTGIQPLIGYNYGAFNYKRLKDSLVFSIKLSLSISVIFIFLFIAFSKYAVIVFINEPQVIEYGSKILRMFTFAIPFAALQMIFMVTLQSMGKALPSLILSLSRQGIVYIPAIIFFNYLWKFDGLIMALPVTDFMTAIIGFVFFYREMSKFKHNNALSTAQV
ncbi:MAG: MATE family efflux transporter [Candidatus Cloacimonetes bacterium]|jgi:putative MATE family efflux protein|nr:MATE family efflux transporter [Candidatus Cloacimonadota bacterium]